MAFIGVFWEIFELEMIVYVASLGVPLVSAAFHILKYQAFKIIFLLPHNSYSLCLLLRAINDYIFEHLISWKLQVQPPNSTQYLLKAIALDG